MINLHPSRQSSHDPGQKGGMDRNDRNANAHDTAVYTLALAAVCQHALIM